MKTAIDSVLSTYLKTYRGLIAFEKLDAKNIVLSFPLHLAAGHRIELTVTDRGNGRYLISDSARTIGEIEAAGYAVTKQMRTRLEKLASSVGARIVDTHVVLESTGEKLGISLQAFLELSKTLGDIYLVHKQREKPDDELVRDVGSVLTSSGLLYRANERIAGHIESHPLEMVVQPNGHPGLAVGILSGHNTHAVAALWYYKCDDIKAGEWYKRANAKLALVYDVRNEPWSEISRAILATKADIAVPSDSLGQLSERLKSQR